MLHARRSVSKSIRQSLFSPTLAVLVVGMASTSPAPAQELSDEYDAVFLLEKVNYEIKDKSNAEFTEHGKIQVFREGGSDWGDIFLTESSFSKLDAFSGKVYDASGRVVYEFGKKDGQKFCGFSGYALYEDICTFRYVLSTTSYPFILEYEYREKHKSLFFWPEWHPQKSIPVLETSYTLVVPGDFDFDTLAVGDIPEPTITEEHGKRIYRWDSKDVPGVEEEDCSVSYLDVRSKLIFAPQTFRLGKHDFTGRSWTEVGDGYREMVSDCFKLNGEQKDMLDRLGSYGIGVQQICDSLHDFLQRRSRYVAIEVGIGGWLPSQARETYERGYGDCKDLSTMYVAMLRYLGIKAGLALLLTKNRGATYADFPTLNRFNHVIIYSIVDGDTVWTDPTCESCRFGDLPFLDEDLDVLAIDPYESRMVHTPSAVPSANLIRRIASITPGLDRSLAVALRFIVMGNAAQLLQSMFRGFERHEWESIFKTSLFGVSDKFAVDSIVAADQSLRNESTEVTIFGRVSNATHTVSDKQYLDLTFLSCFCRAEEIDLGEREQSVDLRFPRSYLDSIIVVIPEGYQVPDLPPDTSLSGPFEELSVTSAVDSGRLILVRTKQIKSYYVKANELLQFEVAIDRQKLCVPSHVALVKQ